MAPKHVKFTLAAPEPTNQIALSNSKQSDWSPLEPGLKISFLNDLRNIEPKYEKFSLPEPF